MKYKLIQLTNPNIGQIAANQFLPLGRVTRKLNSESCDCATFQVGSSTSDTVTVSEPGYYKVTYTASVSAGAAAVVSIDLVANGTVVNTVSETAAAVDDYVDLTLVFILRVCPNCCSSPNNFPVALQVQLGDTATSATELSSANLIIEKIY